MSSVTPAAAFAPHLRHQHATLERFVEVLERERAVLNEMPVSIDALAALTDAKRSLADELERLEVRRQAIVADSGLAPDLTGGEELATQCDCLSVWHAFVDLVDQARMCNQTNGLAVHNRLDFAERTLEFLRRASAKTLYAANGQRRTAAGQRIQSGA